MTILEANDENFGELIQGEYTVVDFYGDHCGACVMLAPIFEEAANDMPYIRFIHINLSHNPKIGALYKIHAIPTLYFYRNGKIVHNAVGAMDREELNSHIAKMLYE